MSAAEQRRLEFEYGESIFGEATMVAMVHSRMYDRGVLLGVSGIQDGVKVVVPVWKVQYCCRTSTGLTIECSDYLDLVRVTRLHMTVLCPLFSAILVCNQSQGLHKDLDPSPAPHTGRGHRQARRYGLCR